MGTASALTRRYLIEYARDPLGLVLLVVVPVVFVSLSASTLADFAELLGGGAGTATVEAATAAWAAAFLSGVAMYYQVAGSRGADRRMVLAGLPGSTLVAARLAAGLVLAGLAAAAGLLALATTAGLAAPGQVVAGTAMAAVIYLGVGALLATLVRDELTGIILLLFVWILDVFLGPTMVGADSGLTRLMPTHFVSLVIAGVDTRHAGELADPLAALGWVVVSVAVLALVVGRAARVPRSRRASARAARWRAVVGAAFVDYRRNVAVWLLFLAVPAVFVLLSMAVTPPTSVPVEVTTAGELRVISASLIDVHGTVMGPVATAFLAGVAGLFVVLGSVQADRRLVLAGFRVGEVLVARIAVVALATVLSALVATAALGVSAFQGRQWLFLVLGVLLVGMTYGLIGVALGPFVGRVGGVLLMLALPFIDVGIAQNPMFGASPPSWGAVLPARGGIRLVIDAALTTDADQGVSIAMALAWLAVAAVAAAVVFRRVAIGTAAPGAASRGPIRGTLHTGAFR